MTRAQEYRYLAERVRDRARQADINLAAEWEQLARCYLLLAEQAERNEQADILTIRYCPSPIRKLRLVGNARKRRSEELAFKLPKSKFPKLSEDTTCDRLSEPQHSTYTIVGFARARSISRMSPWCTVAT